MSKWCAFAMFNGSTYACDAEAKTGKVCGRTAHFRIQSAYGPEMHYCAEHRTAREGIDAGQLTKRAGSAFSPILGGRKAGTRIKTSFVFPPIPVRSLDWQAYDDTTYDGEGCPLGHGATEQEAIDDLIQQMEDRSVPLVGS